MEILTPFSISQALYSNFKGTDLIYILVTSPLIQLPKFILIWNL